MKGGQEKKILACGIVYVVSKSLIFVVAFHVYLAPHDD
jgi:hypothetical protein